MAVHPGGEGLICSLPKSCRWFEWDFQRAENRSLGLISSERVLEPLQDVGQQLALTFNHEVLYLPLAVRGTIEGDVLIVSSNNFQVQNVVKKAHLGLVTTLKFSEDSRALLSASMDSRVRVTIIKDEEKKSGLSLWIVILVLLIAIAVYYAASKRILPLELNSILK